MAVSILLGNIPATLADNQSKFDFPHNTRQDLRLGDKTGTRTFVMRYNSSGYLNISPGREIAGRRFEEKERLLGDGVVQLLDMIDIIPPYSDDL